VIPIAFVARRYLNLRWTALAIAIYLFSPQALTLSLSSHGHLLSRAFLSLALWAFVEKTEGAKPRRSAFLLGLFTGLGVISRPYELLMLLLPFYISIVVATFRRPKEEFPLLAFLVLGALGPMVIMAWYNLQTTGDIWTGTRGLPLFKELTFPGYEALKNQTDPSLSFEVLWRRLGGNLTNNLLGVWMWFYAPLGGVLVLLGIFQNNLSKLMGWGLLACFLMALFHDNYGIHLVGPINYSECLPFLPLLAAFGTKRIFESGRAQIPRIAEHIGVTLTALLLCSFVFVFINWRGLRSQASLHQSTYDFVDGGISYFLGPESEAKVIVLVGQYIGYAAVLPDFQEAGTYVYEWRIPRPDHSERVIFLRDDPTTLDKVRSTFPDRKLIRMKPSQKAPYREMSLVP
jgi:4-amino-4-deoxy-L-arabinose transferase-like glycosyltransferase